MFVVKLLWRTFSYHSKEKHPNLDFFSMPELLYDANINTDWAYYDLSFVNSDLKNDAVTLQDYFAKLSL